jgi:hypothetical protein
MPPSPTSPKDTQRTIQENVEANALNLTLSALSAALGDVKVLKLTFTNKNSPKYEILHTDEEITAALSWIARYGHANIFPENASDENLSYFILQQSTTNMAAWNALIDRNLGRVPSENKLDITATFDLAKLGEKAIEARKRQIIDGVPVGAIPASWVTAE